MKFNKHNFTDASVYLSSCNILKIIFQQNKNKNKNKT